MMHGRILAVAASYLICVGPIGQATAATFEVVEENGGSICWLRAKVSDTVSVSLFAERGSKPKDLALLIEDDETDQQTFQDLGETFPISITLESGERLFFQGSYDEELAGPSADAAIGEIKKIINQKNWMLSIGTLLPEKSNDIISEPLFNKLLACSKR